MNKTLWGYTNNIIVNNIKLSALYTFKGLERTSVDTLESGDIIAIAGIENINIELLNSKMAGQFSLHISLSLIAGIVFSFPFTLREIWAFVSPGLTFKEREKLKMEAEAEVARVKAQYRRTGGTDKGRERQLEINAIQNSTDKETLLLEIKALKQKHEHEIEVIENEYKTELKKKQEETGRMIKLIVDGYELEMKRMKKKFISCSKLLSQAIHDIEVLNARNEKHSKTPNGVK